MYLEILALVSIIFLYLGIILILNKKKILEKHNLSLYGPFLMIKTEKGKNLIYKLSKKRKFWISFGNLGIMICISVMIVMIYLLVKQFLLLGENLSKEVVERLPGINMVLVIPGINPLLPFGYTILAIIIGIIFHEFSHGIVGASQGMNIKSLGILTFIFPIGAFVEPDEEQLKKMEKRKRMRIFSSGPLMNLLVAFLCLILFSSVFMSCVDVAKEGIGVGFVEKNSPAEKIGIEVGCIITEINGTPIKTIEEFLSFMNKTSANQTLSIKFYKRGKIISEETVLADKYKFTGKEDDRMKGFLGIAPTLIHIYGLYPLKHPFRDFPQNFFYLYSLPFYSYLIGYNPLAEPYTNFYAIDGVLSEYPHIFWVIVNSLFWIFWLNLAIGLFNVLPIVPLDGGYLMQDIVGILLERLKFGREKRERMMKSIMISISLLTLFLVLFPLLLKYTYTLIK